MLMLCLSALARVLHANSIRLALPWSRMPDALTSPLFFQNWGNGVVRPLLIVFRRDGILRLIGLRLFTNFLRTANALPPQVWRDGLHSVRCLRVGNRLFYQISRRWALRCFIDCVQQLAFVVSINCQRLSESAGRNVKLLAISGTEGFRAFRHKNAVHPLALGAVRCDAITVRQISVINRNHPTV